MLYVAIQDCDLGLHGDLFSRSDNFTKQKGMGIVCDASVMDEISVKP